MSVTLKRDYTAVIIFDTRGYEEPIEKLVEKISNILNAGGAEIAKVANLGQKDFVAGATPKHRGDIFATFQFSGPPTLPSLLAEKTRLDKTVLRVLVSRR